MGLETDRQLVQRVLAGDRQAFAGLVGRYEHAVYAVALKVVDDCQAAEESAQNAFVAAFENLHRLQEPDAFGAWMLVIARREAIKLARSRWKTVPLIEDREAASNEVIQDQELGEVMEALDRLPAHEQHVLMLRYFQEQSVAGIAQITGRSVGTVTKQISRALEKLRERLRRREQ